MNRLRVSLALLAVIGFTAGCESSTEVQVEDLAGTWVASQLRIVDIELPKESNFDLIELGYQAIFVSTGTGSFTIRLEDPEGESRFITGTLEIDGTDVVVTTAGGVSGGEVFVEDEQAALSLTAGLTFDFNGNGEEKPAKLLLVMDRQSFEPTPL
jgi:hypothetical protein